MSLEFASEFRISLVLVWFELGFEVGANLCHIGLSLVRSLVRNFVGVELEFNLRFAFELV